MIVKFKKLNPQAKLPTYSNPKDAGMDLYALEDFTVNPGSITFIDTGLAVQLPEGYEGQVRPRSGLAAKHGIIVVNSPGTIDEGYRGKLAVVLSTVKDDTYFGKAGDKIAQLVVKKVEYHDIVEIQEFDSSTARGDKGFGSSGV
jgi:dUTP pyrophosphatase